MFKPFIVGFGGATRAGSTSEQALRFALGAAERYGAETRAFIGSDIELPLYEPSGRDGLPSKAAELVGALRKADGIILSSPCYHGAISGLVKNAIDYSEELRMDARTYWEGRAIGCIGCGLGWQGPNLVLSSLRDVAHALRGWPSPLGVAVNTALVKLENGHCSDKSIAIQLETMAAQVVRFCFSQGSSAGS